jgi:hypothetical protein
VPLSCLASHLAVAADPPSAITDIGTLDAENVAKPFKSKQTYSPAASWNYSQRVYRGDTHLHTSASMDAGALGEPQRADACLAGHLPNSVLMTGFGLGYFPAGRKPGTECSNSCPT